MSDYWVSLSYATFGIRVVNGRVASAAPIARWMIGKDLDTVGRWIDKKVVKLSNYKDWVEFTVVCAKCHRRRKVQYMQEAVWRNFDGDEPAGIWKCNSSVSCRKAQNAQQENPHANGHTCDRT